MDSPMDGSTELQEEIICPLCHSVFDTPRTLQCLHSYCEECLFQFHRSRRFADTLDCPECREITTMDQEGIHGLKVNFKLKRFAEILTAEQKREIVRQVNMRPVPLPRKLSSSCQTNPPHCDQHTDKSLDYYCTQCRVLICSQCMLDSHRFHRDPVPAKDTLREKIGTLKASTSQAKTILFKANSEMNRLQSEIDSVWSQVETDVNKAQAYFHKVRCLLEQREMEVCQSIENRASKLQSRINQQRRVILHSTEDVKKALAIIEHAVESRSTDVRVLTEESRMLQNLDSQYQNLSILLDKAARDRPRISKQTLFIPDPDFEAQCQVVGLQTESSKLVPTRHSVVGCVTSPPTPSDSCGSQADTSRNVRVSPSKQKKIIYKPGNSKSICQIDGITILSPCSVFASSSIVGPTHQSPTIAHPGGVCVGNSNTLIITDAKNHQLSILTPTGKFLHSIQVEGSKDGHLLEPTAVMFNHGKMFVADKGRPPRVQLFSESGAFLSKLKVRSGLSYHLGEPLGLVALDNGTVLVSDSEKGCVHMFDEEGKYQGKFGDSEVKTKQPAGIARDSKGNVLIADRSNHCVWIYTGGGHYVSRIGGKQGSAPGELSYPYGIAVDPETGNIFVSESGNHRISIFKPGGHFFCCFGRKGAEPGQFLYPRHLCVDSKGRLIVADEQNHRLQVFTLTDIF